MPARRFPPPWSVEDIGAAFVVKDGAGQSSRMSAGQARVLSIVRMNRADAQRQKFSVPAIQLGVPSGANGMPNRGKSLEAHHPLLERRCGGTHRPFADIRREGSEPLWSPKPLLFLLLNRAGFSARRNRPYFHSNIRTPRRTIRSEYSDRTHAQTILVQ
jgi:hypothetical protein